jgi:hypothetical protein
MGARAIAEVEIGVDGGVFTRLLFGEGVLVERRSHLTIVVVGGSSRPARGEGGERTVSSLVVAIGDCDGLTREEGAGERGRLKVVVFWPRRRVWAKPERLGSNVVVAISTCLELNIARQGSNSQ